MTETNSDTLHIFSNEALYQQCEHCQEKKETLNRINQKICCSSKLSDILDFLFDELSTVMACDRLDVVLFEDDNHRMVIHSCKTNYEPVLLQQGYVSDIIGGSIRKVYLSGGTSIIDDMVQHAERHPQSHSAQLLMEEGIRSSIVCPLVVQEGHRPIGMLMCRSRLPHAFSIKDACFFRAFADQLSNIVEQAAQIERLSTAINSYMEMLSFVSHELKNPLSSIIMLGNTMTSGYLGKLNEKQFDMVSRMIRKAEMMLALSNDYLNLANFESGTYRLHPRNVDFIAKVIEPCLQVLEPEPMHLDVLLPNDIPQVKCDPELMQIVINNFLSNAVKYGKPGGALNLSVIQRDESILIKVRNEGPGFPPSQKQKLFRRFSRIDKPELREKKGHGVGLYVSWKIIQLHGGKIWARSQEGHWAEFCFEIPLLMDRCMLP
jgi:signal transduction histidine kinase